MLHPLHHLLAGYLDVRPGAHMYSLFYSTQAPNPANKVPIILWLQGGPGASGIGYGEGAGGYMGARGAVAVGPDVR